MSNRNAKANNRTNKTSQHQHGATLLVSLMMLVIVLIIGVSLASIALMGEKSSRNDRDRKIAYEAAESALTDAEMDIENAGTTSRSDIFAADSAQGFTANCGAGNTNKYQGLCDNIVGNNAAWKSVDVDIANSDDNSKSVAYGRFTGNKMQTGGGSLPAKLPRYIIELMNENTVGSATNNNYMYRITAIGFGSDVDTQVVLQTFYKKP